MTAQTPQWCIYYADGSQFSSEQGGVRDAPRVGVVAIAQSHDWVGYEIVHSQDYYYWEPALGGWFCSDLIGAVDHLIRCRDPLVLFGRMVSYKQYQDTLTRIRETYGEKQGWLQTERRR